jgi:hypothetical protein
MIYITQQKSFKCMRPIDSVGRDTSLSLDGEPVSVETPALIEHDPRGSPLARRAAQVHVNSSWWRR